LQDDFNRIIRSTTAPDAPQTLLFTIFLGANDACIAFGDREYVPWPVFSENIRGFLDTILTEQAMENTKIVLITPPPINGAVGVVKQHMSQAEVEQENRTRKQMLGYRTYMNKKRYAEGIMGIAKEYEETERVAGLNFWQDIVDALANEEGWEYDAELPPGCGLLGSKSFPKGWFTDGLHLDTKGYAVLNKGLFKLVTEKWPELSPEKL
jgi:lysophospholipase L1-like esterase